MLVRSEALVSAAFVAPNTDVVWFVALTNSHATLMIGDVVMMREAPDRTNYLVRMNDFTIHSLQGEGGYVVLCPRASVKSER